MRLDINKAILGAVYKLLKPLIRILLRNGIPFGTFADIAKGAYVEVAMDEFRIPGKKQTVSRVSIITGLSRKEVSRINETPQVMADETIQRYNRAARVISGWVRDNRFKDSSGIPADLVFEGEGATFSELVRSFSGDIPARAILDELLRVGVVERTSDGRIRLLNHAYIPHTGEVDKLGILGMDVRDLICTIDHNLNSDASNSYFQRKVNYDNLSEEFLPELRSITTKRGQYLLEEMDRWISQHDRDVNPAINGTGRKRAGIGIYYFEEDLTETEKGKSK